MRIGDTTTRARLLLLICGMLLTGCATLTAEIDPPVISLESFRALPAQTVGPRFEIVLLVQNPNKQELDIAGIAYTIELLDRELISGVTNDVPLIAGYSEETITLEAGVNLIELLRLLGSLGRSTSDALDYRFSAKIDFNGFLPTQRVAQTGEITLQ
jgi:LEA14-like dessication related protein